MCWSTGRASRGGSRSPRCAVVTDHDEGLGVRAEALSGFWLGGLPVGLLDRFVVTGWTPPDDGSAELEVLHLGPYFTGEGVFALRSDGTGHHGHLHRDDQRARRSGDRAARTAGPAADARRLREAACKALGIAGAVLGPAGVSAEPGPDGRLRCPWALSTPEYVDYHDLRVGPAGHHASTGSTSG